MKPANSNKVDHVLYNHHLDWNKINSPNLTEESVELDLPYGRINLKQWSFDGILIRSTKTWYNNNNLFENKNVIDAVGLEFNIKGSYDIFHVGNTYNVNGNQHNIIYTPSFHNTVRNNERYGENFKVYFQPEVFLNIVEESNKTLANFSGGVIAKQPTVIAPVSPVISPQLNGIIRDILFCKFKGNMKKVFLRSKCLELLVVQSEAFNTDESQPSADLKKVQSARDYLIEHHQNPPTLHKLSREIGLNEYKLKRDFKAVYNSTVFGFISEYRLEEARKALLRTRKSIAEIAYDLGYSSPQHFSNAFKKRFGLSPGQMRNN